MARRDIVQLAMRQSLAVCRAVVIGHTGSDERRRNDKRPQGGINVRHLDT